jgi:hypothetical protein
VLPDVTVLKAQIGVPDATNVVTRQHPLRAQRPRRTELLWLAENGEDDFWLAQRPHEGALNSPPSVETLETVLGTNLPSAVPEADQEPAHAAGATLVSDPIRIFISGSCAGLAEVRQALSSHSAIKVVGTAVDAPSAGDRLREEQVDVLLHGSSRGDRCPTQDIHTLQFRICGPDRHRDVGLHAGVPPGGTRTRRAGRGDPAQLTESLVFTLRRAHVLNNNAPRQQAQPSVARSGGEGRVITCFSPKGGVGKSTLSTALAGVYSHQLKQRTLLIDLDLQFGDIGIMMGIDPTQTIVDLVTTPASSTPTSWAATSSGTSRAWTSSRRRCARGRRARDRGSHRPADRRGQGRVRHRRARHAAALRRDHAGRGSTQHRLVLITTMDIPTVKNAKLASPDAEPPAVPARAHRARRQPPARACRLRESDISRTLDMPITCTIPGDKEIASPSTAASR